eukprot:TRINITY_DN13770_c0_g1_i1.p1 TRINITY_DN13770_c0_g1~~TRINITY_DN13770_c0_g1_i1.p1  ORF type:complete len:384 (-),score=74.20 TRINITY_DN13770_c0_g1_i1:21-1172(-)
MGNIFRPIIKLGIIFKPIINFFEKQKKFGMIESLKFDKSSHYEEFVENSYEGYDDIKLFFLTYYGVGMKKDEEKAKEICMRGHLNEEILIIGIRYFFGWDCEGNLEKAIENFELYCKRYENDEDFDFEVGHIYNFLGFFHSNSDTEKSMYYYKKGVEKECTTAMNNLANLYENGNGVEKNLNIARILYEKSASKGNCLALNNLGYFYESGNYFEKDLQKAREFYIKATKFGSVDAFYNLAKVYIMGKGVEKNVEKGLFYFEEAVKRGDIEVIIMLAKMYKYGDENVQQNHLKACEYYLKLINYIEKENVEKYKQKIMKVISERQIDWCDSFHSYWIFNENEALHRRLITLFLISKHRRESNASFMVKGITAKIIKFLCNFEQK